MGRIRRSADNAGAWHAHRPASVTMAAAGTVVLAIAGGACGHANTAPSSPPPTTLSTALPHVTAVSPETGFANGGASVTITGNGFTGATQVDFGRVRATKMTVDSDAEITAASPSGPLIGQVDVTVVTPRGRSATSPADQFSYHP